MGSCHFTKSTTVCNSPMTRIEILPRNLPQFVDDLAKGVDAIFVSCLGDDFWTHGEEVVRRMQQVEPGKPIAFEVPQSAVFVRSVVEANVPRAAVVRVKVDGVVGCVIHTSNPR